MKKLSAILAALALPACAMVSSWFWIWIVGLLFSGVLLVTVASRDRLNFIASVSLIAWSILLALQQHGKLQRDSGATSVVAVVGLSISLAHFLRRVTAKAAVGTVSPALK